MTSPPRFSLLARWTLVLVGMLPAPVTAQAVDAEGDGRVRALIQEIRAAAPRVTLDGRADDWGPVPVIPDPSGDVTTGDPSRDIVGVSVLPLEDVILVRIDTRGRPSTEDRAFWVNLDVAGWRVAEVQVGLSPDGNHFVRRYDGAGNALGMRRVPFPSVTGSVVELAFPHALLEAALRGADGTLAPGAGLPGDRNWVRVVAFTWDRASGAFTDFAAAASYRIVADGGALDPPLPDPPAPPTLIDFPLAGAWMVSQGAFGAGSHGQIWAYDFSKADEGLRWAAPEGTCENADFWSWDQPVTAPAPGRVVRSANDRPDEIPCGRTGAGGGNEVYLDVGGDVGIWMAHLRRGTVSVEAGARVEAGRPLGRVGNSGRSTGPHLHLGAYRLSDGQTTLPLALRNVRVGLNPTPDDPWARWLDVWEPRDGFFVEKTAPRPAG